MFIFFKRKKLHFKNNSYKTKNNYSHNRALCWVITLDLYLNDLVRSVLFLCDFGSNLGIFEWF